MKNEKLEQDIFRIVNNPEVYKDGDTAEKFQQRAGEDDLTKDENPATHFCVYFLPFNPKTKEVFIIHHKKSGLWLSPGGHIDEGENVWQAVNREIDEELGMKNFFTVEPTPFLLTVTPIEIDVRPCRVHYDIWHLVETDGSKFNLDPREFFDAKWLSIEKAREIVVNKQNLQALEIIKNTR